MITYTKDRCIGGGSYGKCYSAISSYGQQVAIKEFLYNDYSIMGYGNLRELDILSKLSDISVTPKLLDIIYNDDEIKDGDYKLEKISIVTELALCDGATFFIQRDKCTEDVAIKLSSDLLIALDVLENKHISHRDIKPGNILIFNDYNGGYKLKLCDFGFANFLCNLCPSTPSTYTVWYRPPEICWEINQYGITSDIWAAACTIYEIFTGNILFKDAGVENGKIFNFILDKIPFGINNDIINLYISEGNIKITINKQLKKLKGDFIPLFKTSRNYSNFSLKTWENLNILLLKMFDFNYKTRVVSNACLNFSLFDKNNDNIILHRKTFDNKIQLDAIRIQLDDILNINKKQAFSVFLDQYYIQKLGIRTLFHALDLFNSFYLKYPKYSTEYNDVFKIVAASLYFYNKYFSILSTPFLAEEFFGIPKYANKFEYLKELGEWVCNFEKNILQNIFSNTKKNIKYCIYRKTPYELYDDYSRIIRLNDENVKQIFIYFLEIKSWNKSYRYMLRNIIKKHFDNNLFTDHIIE